MKIPNLRKQVITSTDGKRVTETSQLSGEAKRSPVENEKNQTVQEFTGKGKGSGPWGGENTGS
jgi:hypothetical protein